MFAVFARYRKCRPSSYKDLLHAHWQSASRLVDRLVRQFRHNQVMDCATSSRNQKKFWTLVKIIVDVQSVPPQKDNLSGDFVFSEVDKANVLNKYLAGCQQSCLTHCSGCHSPMSPVPPVAPVSPAATFTTITAKDILSTLRQIDARNFNGTFLLTHELLRRCGSSLLLSPLPLLILFSSTMENGSFPSSWNRSFITAISKDFTDRSSLAALFSSASHFKII